METAAPSEILADLIVGISFFGLGIVLYMTAVDAVSAIQTTGHQRRLNVAYALFRLGTVIMVGLITEAVYRAGAVRPEWRTWLYIVAGLMFGIGALGVAIETRKVKQ